MAQTVKLKDGSYIDATGVYDTTEGKTQEEVNSANSFSNRIKTVTAKCPSTIVEGTAVDFPIPEGALVLSIQAQRISPSSYTSEMLNSNMAQYCNYVNRTTFRMIFSGAQGQYANQTATLYYLQL